jgi:hypothetical protein
MAVEQEMTSIAPWLGQESQTKHEIELAKLRLKQTKAESKAKVKVAKIQSSDHQINRLVTRIAIAVVIVLLASIGGCTYYNTQPVDPTEQKLKHDKYLTCMETEKKYDECKYADE